MIRLLITLLLVVPAVRALDWSGDGVSLGGAVPGVVVVTDGTATTLVLGQATGTVDDGPVSTPCGPGRATTTTWDTPVLSIDRTVTVLDQQRGCTLRLQVRNRTGSDVVLRDLDLAVVPAGGFLATGVAADWWISSSDSHDGTRGGFLPSATLATTGHRRYVDVLTCHRDGGRHGVVIGAIGPGVADVGFSLDVAAGGVGLTIASEMGDVVVAPGEVRISEEVAILPGSRDTGMAILADAIVRTHGSRTGRAPPVGWCSWYDRAARVDAAHVDDVVAALERNRDRFPAPVVQIDDGWQMAYGDWRCNGKFPDGLAPLAARITAAGGIPGIWMCPIRSSPAGAHPDGRAVDYLDSTDPRVRTFVRDLIQARKSEGFRYFKLDFNHIRLREGRQDRTRTRFQILRDLFRLYREAIGEEGYLLACVGGFSRAAVGYADAERIGTDSCPSWGSLYAGCTIADCASAVGAMAWTNGRLFTADPDVSYTLPRGTLSADELQTWHGLVGLLGGTAMVSEPLADTRYAAPPSLRRLEMLWPPAPERGHPLSHGDAIPRHFGFRVERPWGRWSVVQVTNADAAPAMVGLVGCDLAGLPERFHAWSFWDGRYLGIIDRTWGGDPLPGHGSRLLRLTPCDPGRPVVVGSDLHIACGSAEIRGVRTTRDALTIDLGTAGARDGSLWIASPGILALDHADACTATILPAGDGLWRIAVADRTGTGQRVAVHLRQH